MSVAQYNCSQLKNFRSPKVCGFFICLAIYIGYIGMGTWWNIHLWWISNCKLMIYLHLNIDTFTVKMDLLFILACWFRNFKELAYSLFYYLFSTIIRGQVCLKSWLKFSYLVNRVIESYQAVNTHNCSEKEWQSPMLCLGLETRHNA